MRRICGKGGDPVVVGSDLAVLAVMACGAALLGFRRFRQTLN